MNHKKALSAAISVALLPVALQPVTLLAQENVSDGANYNFLEVVEVTATRRSESLKEVPISVSAFNQELLDQQGLKEVDDLVQFTPGLSLRRGDNGSNVIAIRGIASNVGAGTTGIYIDDTPIQARNLGYAANSAFPVLFDVQRVEVLRGPQGTLFGAGSQGGTVRFIQTEPDVNAPSVYARSEYSVTDGGDSSYEAGIAGGMPLIDGKLGIRVSAFQRTEGGWIDRIDADPVVVDATGDSGPASLQFTNRETITEDTNSTTTDNYRIALQWQPTDRLQITPSITYQNQERDDGFNSFWMSASSGGDYARLATRAGSGPEFIDIGWPDTDSGEDEFTISAVNVVWDLDFAELYSTTSYFDRSFYQYSDMTPYYDWWYGRLDESGVLATDGHKAVSKSEISQKTLTQEVRLQSISDGPLEWVAGFFYSDAEQDTLQNIRLNFLNNADSIKRFYLPDFLAFVDDGFPYGPGFSAYQNHFGINPSADGREWGLALNTTDEQFAVFGQVDYDMTEKLRLTAGLRVARNEQTSLAQYSGATNNLNAPINNLGAPVPAPFNTPEYVSATGDNAETSVTPKFGVSYKFDADNMAYASAAKGFRPAGVSKRLVGICDGDLASYGYTDGDGNPSNPTEYDSDTVWSYEIGSKNSMLDSKLYVETSAYYIKWDDIQSLVFLTNCAEGFTANLGSAESSGFDLLVRYNITPNLQISSSIGYNDTHYSEDVFSPNGTALVTDGSAVAGAVTPWMASFSGQYFFGLPTGQEGYFRADVAYRSSALEQGATDPDSPTYNADRSPNDAYTTVNIRAGVQFSKVDVSLFVDNLANEDVLLNAANRDVFSGASRLVWRASTIRPRTAGVFVTYRY